MPKTSKPDRAEEEKTEVASSDVNQEQPQESLNQEIARPRKSSPSKREIMEELSRARFPWDE
jgi:hypothetical protein